jgi:hypothetical protein
MSNLVPLIANWRRQMTDGGLCDPEVLRELESHLRDDLEEQMNSGMDAWQAFESAVNHVGPAIELNLEFRKAKLNQPMKPETLVLLRKILSAIAIAAIAVGLILPVLAKLRHDEALARFDIAMLLLGTVLMTGSAMFGAYTLFTRHKA